MIDAGEDFLPRETNETQTDYTKRLNRTILFNATKKSIQALAGKPFSKPVTVEVDSKYAEKIKLLEKSFDSRGDNITQTARNAFVNGLWDGMCHFLVDKDVSGNGLPYVTMVRDDAVLSADEVDGELVLLRIREHYKVASEDGLMVHKLERVRIFRKLNGVVEWCLFDESPQKKGEFFNSTGWIRHSLSYIPFVTFYASPEDSAFMNCDSPLLDLAYENIGHWQNSSDQRNILHVARVPILFAKGLSDDQEITIGPSAMIVGNTDGADMKYVEHSGAAINAGRDSIKDSELRMQALGLEMMTLKSGSETATGQALAAESTNSSLAAMAISLAGALERVFTIFGEFMLIADLKASVNIHTDYGITMSTQELQALATARQLGDLSHEDYMSELKRRGILRNAFDLETNKDRIEAETNSF